MSKGIQNINEGLELPIKIKLSFQHLVESYKPFLDSDNPVLVERAKRVFEISEANPVLVDGFEKLSILEEYEASISQILEDSFSSVLTTNEIKAATIPFQNFIFNESARFKKIIADAGPDYDLSIRNMPEEHFYILGCTIVLNSVYKRNVNYNRPLFFDIPDAEGVMRSYRILYNGDFLRVNPTDKSIPLTEEDINELLDNFDNIDMWREKFPPHSYECSGIVIANMFDVTTEESISSLKSNLLESSERKGDENFMEQFEGIFQSLFKIPDLKIGFTVYNEPEKTFEAVHEKGIHSFILDQEEKHDCSSALCEGSYKVLLEDKNYFAISDVEKYYKMSNGMAPYKKLYDLGYRSAIFAPIADGEKVLAILELVSPRPYELHSINANKLVDVMPYLVATVMQSKREEETLIQALIQKEFTAIHPSVYWKFEDEVCQYLKKMGRGQEAELSEIVFEDVYPLYGQIDIKRSSDARNDAIKKDLGAQLHLLEDIFSEACKEEGLPIYDEILFRINGFINEIQEDYKTNSEELVNEFLREDIHPLIEHLKGLTSKLEAMIVNYEMSISSGDEGIYHFRKDYDQSVMIINKEMAEIIDEKQEQAQSMFPHFFERYKTDGVEHNMYIGQSISKERKFSPIYLQNLRLWQLQTMCEMEVAFYRLRPNLPVQLDVASMILVHSATMAIRFRMDEHKFDVDGTYNARYEIIKKRLDKAHVKDTNERITQAGKIAIVYANRKEENEYLRHIKLLQAKGYISDTIEMLEIEPLQGVSGLKAIRIELLYTFEGNSKQYLHKELQEVVK